MAEQLAGHPEQVRQLFDAKAATWSAKYAPDGRLISRLSSLAGALARYVPAGGRVLDLGCGTGELARAAAAASMRVAACDISPDMLVGATAQDPDSLVDWVQLDLGWRTLPFEPASFDAVVGASVLEYVDDPAAVLGECARVLRPGGFVLCTVPNTWHPVRWLEWLLRAMVCCPAGRIASRGRPRLVDYFTYLRISRQRHLARWWRTAAMHAGMRIVPGADAAGMRSTLRLFVFQRLEELGEA